MGVALILVVVAVAAVVGFLIWYFMQKTAHKDEEKDEEEESPEVVAFKSPLDMTQASVPNTQPQIPEIIVPGDGSILPTDIQGLVGWFNASSWDAGQKMWKDMSGNDHHAIDITGNPTSRMNDPLISHISGGPSDTILFPEEVMQRGRDFTLFHVSRYNGNKRGRIIDGYGNNWFSGFNAGHVGFAWHDGLWFYHPVGSVKNYNDWLLSTDMKGLYRANGQTATKVDDCDICSRGSAGTGTRISINRLTEQNYGGASDWAVAEIVVYNRELNEEEINGVERYLANKMKSQESD